MTILPATSAATHGQVTIDASTDVELHSKWCRLQNFQMLFGSGPKRGSDRVIPHLAGAQPRRRRRTSREMAWELYVAGDVNAAGTAYASYSIGLESNGNTLDALCDDPGGDGTTSVTVTWPSGATSTKSIHILEYEPGQFIAPGLIAATLTVSIPDGRF